MTLLLFKQIVSLFIMMGMGFVLVKTKLVRSEESHVLSVLSIYLIMPCTVIKAFQIELTPQIQKGFLVALAAALISHVFLLLVDQVNKCVLHLNAVERDSIIYSNAGNLIIPLVTSLLGEEWVIYASAFICVQLVFVWTHGYSLISGQRQIQFKKVLTNVNLIAVVVGFLLMIFRIRLPEMVMKAVTSVAGAIGPVSMIMIGMILASVDMKRMLTDTRVYLVTCMKMIVTPALSLLVIWASHLYDLVPDGKTILLISFLAVITPSAATVTSMAQLCRNQPDHASAINAMGTIMCIATMPAMVFLFEKLI